MTYIILALIAILWIVGGFISYKKVFSTWDNSKFEKIWFSCVWVPIVPLYIIHYFHNK